MSDPDCCAPFDFQGPDPIRIRLGDRGRPTGPLVPASAFVRETKRPDDCHPDYRFRATLACGTIKHFKDMASAVDAVVRSARGGEG